MARQKSCTLGANDRRSPQRTAKIVYWHEGKHWLGFFQDYPDYVTQGKSLDELKGMLKDLYRDMTSGEIPGIRKVQDLVVS